MEYRSECGVLENKRVRYYFRYPVAAPFGEYYSEVAKKCLLWAQKEYGEYSGRGITYRFLADASFCGDGITSVTVNFYVDEKGEGRQKQNFYAQNWIDSGRVLPIFALKAKNIVKSIPKNAIGYFISNGEICFFAEKGQKNPTGVKFGKLSQEIFLQNLKKSS